MRLGLDIGSKNISYAIISDKSIVTSNTIPHYGNVDGTLTTLVDEIKALPQWNQIEYYGVCGNAHSQRFDFVDPITASVEANRFLQIHARTIISIGCETFYLIMLDAEHQYVEHTVNSDCAAGTGGFIDQQAQRLGFTTAKLAELALSYQGKVPTIATRCAVFAKSDIIHAQAQGFSKEAICTGICEGVVRTVVENVIKGRDLDLPILFIGGVARNSKVIDTLSTRIGHNPIVPENPEVANAIGAALLGHQTDIDPQKIIQAFKQTRKLREPLTLQQTKYPDFNQDRSSIQDNVEITQYQSIDDRTYEVSIGIDIGSTSTKAIVMDHDRQILTGLYTRTNADPVGATRLLLNKINQVFQAAELCIKSVVTTGSGRHFVKDVFNMDDAINEITAHAYGATFIDPGVDTIIEIGGQDSKFTLLKNGHVTHSAMNYTCAAGTGSFIEEQAQRLNISLEDISRRSFGPKAPYTSDRCTVYMERDLNVLLSEGWTKDEIITAVLFSVRDNYLSKVVGRSLLGNKVYFQGATARNKALVAVFEQEIGNPILVSKYCHLTGALGAALHGFNLNISRSIFQNMDFTYELKEEICNLCANQCALNVYFTPAGQTAWGMKCGRDYNDRKVGHLQQVSALEKEFHRHFKPERKKYGSKPVIGIPNTLYMVPYTTLFCDLFDRLGIDTIVAGNCTKSMATAKEHVNADFCAPINALHGIVKSLVDQDVDYIFFQRF